ncbi:MAG: nickel-responsive transcriptional regulator NikR [Planctomycetota bacterium]
MSKRGRKPRKRGGTEPELVRLGISIPADLLKRFDLLLSARNKQNRSDAIRDLIRDRLVQEAWSEGKSELVATVTLVYDGQGTETQRALAEGKRALGMHLLACLHVRLGPRQEMELMALRGPAASIRTEAESIRASKGILHGKVVFTTPSAP